MEPELDTMAVTKGEWQRIEQIVESAARPQGWRKLAIRLREWGFTGLAATAFFALVAIAVTLAIAIFRRVGEDAQFRQRTEDRLESIEKSLFALRLSQAARNPTNPNHQNEAKAVLAEARRKSIRLPSEVLEQTGDRFVEAAKVEPKAWGVVLECAGYRSFLNESLYVGDKDAKPLDQSSDGTAFHFEFRDDSASIVVTMAGGPGAVRLDQYRIRNVGLRKMHIMYGGGPLVLDNVHFIDGTFEIPLSQEGRTFLATSTTPAPVSLVLKA